MQDTQNPIIQFLINVISQIPMSIVSGVGLFGLIYLIFWVILAKPLAKYKVQLSKSAGWSQIKFEITNTILVVATRGIFTGIILWLKVIDRIALLKGFRN